LYVELSTRSESKIYFIILLQNFSKLICHAKVSRIRKESILFFQKMHPKLADCQLTEYAVEIVSKMRNCENDIVSQQGLFLSRTIFGIPDNDDIQLKYQKISATDEIVQNIRRRFL